MKVPPYKCYLFDIDRTLFDFNANAKEAMRLSILEMHVQVSDFDDFWNKYQVVNAHYWHLYEHGEIDKETLRRERIYQALVQVLGVDDRAYADNLEVLYLGYMGRMTTMMPHAKEVVVALKERGARLGICSNGFSEVQYSKLINCGIRDYFCSVVISDEVGVNKPFPKIFELAMKGAGGTRQDTIMVGDDVGVDIEGAQVFGIDQYYYNPGRLPCDCAPTYTGDTLLDLI
jgi:putative hydrolase of the HAD superfamily